MPASPPRAHPVLARLSPVIALLIMCLGSLGLWVGSPLMWLWIGSQIEASSSIGTALGAMALGFVVTVWLFAMLLSRLSNAYRVSVVERGRPDPGHAILETVLVVSAALTMAVFGVWFLIFA